jgi:hypothetical protein
LEITPAAASDLPDIAAVLEDARRWLAGRGSEQWQRPFTTTWIAERIASGEFWIARRDSAPIAVARMLWADPLFW